MSLATSYLINTENRNTSSDDPSNCKITDLQTNLKGYYAVVKGSFPNTVYNVDSKTNTLIFVDDGKTRTATVTPGFYSAATLCDGLKTAMEEANDEGSGSFQAYTITASAVTGKLTFTAAGNFQLVLSGSTIAPIIGLKADSASTTSVTPTGLVRLDYNFAGALITIDEAEPSSKSEDLRGNSYNIYLPITVDSGSIQTLEQIEVPPIIQLKDTNKLTIKVRNTQGRQISLNGCDFQFELKQIPESKLSQLGYSV